MSQSGVNFTALLRDRSGLLVPGSVRTGHNVQTNTGRDILTRLVAWSSLGAYDNAFTPLRARWIGVGDGTQLESPEVVALVSPLTVTSGIYLQAIDSTLNVFPVITGVTLKAVFGPSDLTWSLPSVTVSEAGLFFDANEEGSTYLDPSVSDNAPAYYKTFAPLVKLSSFSLEITWELKF